VALVREISKRYEEYCILTLDELSKKFSNEDQVRGELVVIVEGIECIEERCETKVPLEEFYDLCLSENISKKTISKLASKLYEVSKNKAYEELLSK
ncbi:MAG: hypothetical protein ACRDA4_01885, partial [Filifactoraceae bacterium]